DGDESAPIISLRVSVKKRAVFRRHECRRPPLEVGLAGELAPEVSDDASDVFHQRRRVLENAMVDALVDEPAFLAADAIGRAKRVVDVAAAERRSEERR